MDIGCSGTATIPLMELGCSDTATRFSFVVFHCSKRNVATRFSLMKIEFTLLENTTGLSFTKSNNFAAGRAYRIFIDEDTV